MELSNSVIAAASSVLLALLTLIGRNEWLQRRQTRRAADVTTDGALNILRAAQWDTIRVEVERMGKELKKTNREVRDLVRYVEDLMLWGSHYDSPTDPMPSRPASLNDLLE